MINYTHSSAHLSVNPVQTLAAQLLLLCVCLPGDSGCHQLLCVVKAGHAALHHKGPWWLSCRWFQSSGAITLF